MAFQRPQCCQGSGGAGHSSATALPMGAFGARGQRSSSEPKSKRSVEALRSRDPALACRERQTFRTARSLKKIAGHPLRSAAQRYARIQQMSGQYKVAWLCEALLISRSGYYDWKKRSRRPVRATWRTCDCANAFERSLRAVVGPTAARGWLKCSAVREDATASRVSCAQSASSHVSVPNIEWPQRTVATVGRSRLTGFKVSPSNGPTKFGPPTPLASSPVKAGYISLPSWMSSPAASSAGPCIKSSMLSSSSPLYAWP